MNSIIRIFCLLWTVTCCIAASAQSHAEPISIFVSVAPQKYFVERIGGEQVQVQTMVKGGERPDVYVPSTDQIRQLADARLYFFTGVPYEWSWREVFRQRFPTLRQVECCPGVDLIYDTHHHHHHVHHSDASADTHGDTHHDSHKDHEDTREEAQHYDEYDPHIWVSPRQAVFIADQVLAELLPLAPEHEDFFRVNHQQLVADLKQLDEEIVQRRKTAATNILVVTHPSLAYFARDYGFEQISLEQYGVEVSAGSLVDIITDAKENNVQHVFVQKQFNENAARIFAQETGAEMVYFDPLVEDYLQSMRTLAKQLIPLQPGRG